jgi:hypothetical protein
MVVLLAVANWVVCGVVCSAKFGSDPDLPCHCSCSRSRVTSAHCASNCESRIGRSGLRSGWARGNLKCGRAMLWHLPRVCIDITQLRTTPNIYRRQHKIMQMQMQAYMQHHGRRAYLVPTPHGAPWFPHPLSTGTNKMTRGVAGSGERRGGRGT